MGKVFFISYARDHQDVVRTLEQDLKDDGHETWFDQNLEGGQQWWNEILSQGTRPTRAPVGAACALSVDGGAIGYAVTAVVALAVASWRAFHAHGIRSPTRRAG